ncbi:XRE family transcriptional regulator [Aeromicrobium sp. Root495]|uniref:XRE family transcriptional regulator n=1 Tax=Aeromicrobium sp. Root495 TaxID=1736550 RepID=UPI0006F25732|nr:XRE family transcriptional regulator [Aeromicrobium sp. Root495]KQY58847.1 XRE family transcriptional regulator [Aeromicrobium sp. Root495]
MINTSRPPAASTDFDGTRLTVARRLRGMTKTALANQVGVTPTAIAHYEKGGRPTQAMLAGLCLALGLPREFFGAGRPIDLLPASSAHFRSLRSTSAASREQALAFGELGLELVSLIDQHVDLPATNLPDITVPEQIEAHHIEQAVAELKLTWAIPAGPIGSVVQLLEANGIITMRLPEGTDPKVDAFSTYAGQRPLVLLSPRTGDKARGRFDAAHELGHLILHPDTEPGSKIVENQAHSFAAEFLMPREEIIDQLPRRIDWPHLHELKRHWGVSLRALVYRSKALGVLSDASYRRANQQLSQWGFPEPGPLGPPESPRLLGMVRDLMLDSGVDFEGILSSGRIVSDVADQIIAAATDPRPRIEIGLGSVPRD